MQYRSITEIKETLTRFYIEQKCAYRQGMSQSLPLILRAKFSSKASKPPSKASLITLFGFIAMASISVKSNIPLGGMIGRTKT